MSDNNDKPEIPTLRPTQRQLTKETSWQPNDFQERVKARFWRRMDEMSHVWDPETAFSSREGLLELAGTERIFGWLKEPAFAAWFRDQDYVDDVIRSQVRKNIQKLIEIRDEEDSPAGDAIKAARTLLELADAFPGRKSEVRFIDEQLEGMRDDEVDREMKQLRGKLGQLEGDTGGTTDDD